mgnify:CR=1 FL=1
MPGKLYFDFIAKLQQTMLTLSYVLIILLSAALEYAPIYFSGEVTQFLFELSLFAVFLVMIIRPLADLLPTNPWIRPLVILRKGFGVFSASIILSFVFAHILTDGIGYLSHYLMPQHWSLLDLQFLGPVSDLTAFVLLITSNQYSKRVLGKNWKRIQKLAYVYFAAGALYEFLFLSNYTALFYLLVAAGLGTAAFLVKRVRVPAVV